MVENFEGSSTELRLRSLRTKFQESVDSNLVKVHIMRDKTILLDDSVKQLEKYSSIYEEHGIKSEFQKTVNKILSLTDSLTKMTHIVCKKQGIHKNDFSLLLSIQNEMYPSLDISVKYFGINWMYIHKILLDLRLNIERIFAVIKTGGGELNLAFPSNVIRDLFILRSDVSSHAEAIQKGHLNKSKLELIHREQTRWLRYQRPNIQVQDRFIFPHQRKPESPFPNCRFMCPFHIWRNRRRKRRYKANGLWHTWHSGIQSFILTTQSLPDANNNNNTSLSGPRRRDESNNMEIHERPINYI